MRNLRCSKRGLDSEAFSFIKKTCQGKLKKEMHDESPHFTA
jgi:hypothetical protein